jgi:hypothetical protein
MSRSQEMVNGGHMVLSFMGRNSMDPTSANCCYQWELLAHALMTMVSEVVTYFLFVSIYLRQNCFFLRFLDKIIMERSSHVFQ